MSAVEEPTLRERLEDLPPELYDEIYSLTFTADRSFRIYASPWHKVHQGWLSVSANASSRVTINEKVSHLFHVDRASRKKFSASYWGNGSQSLMYGLNNDGERATSGFRRLMKTALSGLPGLDFGESVLFPNQKEVPALYENWK
ncbi:hypothetical protein Slin15195_G105360 [Septoria linicola]|uniref:Uncharacterized protein n=1 Tax=Septoria linicola TaxID=215465 RepID=A0A9Q9AWK5_9PEZI|nr:hypothetical protein Slin15195_G105360 [Septoria linicola]